MTLMEEITEARLRKVTNVYDMQIDAPPKGKRKKLLMNCKTGIYR